MTLVIAYLTLAFCGLREFYRNRPPIERQSGVPSVSVTPAGVLVQQPGWSIALPRYLLRSLILLLFCLSILKLSAQSYSPFLYFQF